MQDAAQEAEIETAPPVAPVAPEPFEQAIDHDKMNFIHHTRAHREGVQRIMNFVTFMIDTRAATHDASKQEEPELTKFSEVLATSRPAAYGTPEYAKTKARLGDALVHHYQVNRHHPEHFANGMRGMHLIDLIEWLADCYQAASRHPADNPVKSIAANQKRFKFSDDLASILVNTCALFQKGVV